MATENTVENLFWRKQCLICCVYFCSTKGNVLVWKKKVFDGFRLIFHEIIPICKTFELDRVLGQKDFWFRKLCKLDSN